MKPFQEALSDGFKHITSISDPERLKQLREDNIHIDSEGIYVFAFGSNKQFSFELHPIGSDGVYKIVLYKNNIALTEPLVMKALDKK